MIRIRFSENEVRALLPTREDLNTWLESLEKDKPTDYTNKLLIIGWQSCIDRAIEKIENKFNE